MSTMTLPLMHPALAGELHDTLAARGIARPLVQIDNAIASAMDDYRDQTGLPATDAYALSLARPDVWWDMLHRRHGVYDLLEVDSEDALYDRLGVAA